MTTQDRILKSKLGLLKLVDELGNVSKACALMGYSRDSYYRIKDLYDKGGLLALQEKSRRKPNLKNRVGEAVENAIISLAYRHPFYGQSKASAELKKQGISVSSGGVRSVWQRYDLETFEKRMKALGTKMLQDGYHPDDWQVRALQRAQQKYKNGNPLETYFPGHVLLHSVQALHKHPVLKKLYQYTVVDLYTKLTFIQLCAALSSECAVQSLQQKMIPFFRKEGLNIHRMVATKEICFYGKTFRHQYKKFLKSEDIELRYVSNGNKYLKPIREIETLLQTDFYTENFRKKNYRHIEDLQKDLNLWVDKFNKNRPIYQRFNYGKTPLKTFKDSLPFTKYLKQGKSRTFPNGLHSFLELLKPMVIPSKL